MPFGKIVLALLEWHIKLLTLRNIRSADGAAGRAIVIGVERSIVRTSRWWSASWIGGTFGLAWCARRFMQGFRGEPPTIKQADIDRVAESEKPR